MAQVAWRCTNAEGDVKYAAREAHVEILEQKGYTCVLDPDADFDEHDTSIFSYLTEPPGELAIPTVFLDPTTADPVLVFSNYNLTVDHPAEYDDDHNFQSNNSTTGGKWYWEATVTRTGPQYEWWAMLGMMQADNHPVDGSFPGQRSDVGGSSINWHPSFCFEIADFDWNDFWAAHDTNMNDWYESEGYIDPWATVGLTVQFAVDLDTGKVYGKFSTAAEWLNDADPAAGVGAIFTLTDTATTAMRVAGTVVDCAMTYNFGDSQFVGDVPEGFLPWNQAA